MSTLYQRWDAYQERDADAQEGEDSFAVRADGALVVFDKEGYFLLITDEGGTICLQGSDGHRETCHYELSWIDAFYEIVQDHLIVRDYLRKQSTPTMKE